MEVELENLLKEKKQSSQLAIVLHMAVPIEVQKKQRLQHQQRHEHQLHILPPN